MPRDYPKESSRPDREKFFISGDGLEREVVQSKIQRFLGPEAVVKPETYNGVAGYLINAVKQFTPDQLVDLQDMSEMYRQRRREGLNRQDAVTEASRVLSPQGSQRRPLDYPYGITSNENYMEPSYGRGQRSSYETADPYSSQQYPQDARQGPYASLPDTRRPDPNAFPPYPENPYAIPNNSMGPTPSRFGGVGEQSYAPHTPSHPSNPYGPISEASWDPTQGRRERPGDKEATGSQMLRRNKYGLGDCPVDGCRFFGRNGLQDRAHLREHLRQYHPLDPR